MDFFTQAPFGVNCSRVVGDSRHPCDQLLCGKWPVVRTYAPEVPIRRRDRGFRGFNSNDAEALAFFDDVVLNGNLAL